jgi:hypothetical protein
MTPAEFDTSWQRLRQRFGDKACDGEFKRLIALECGAMQAHAFSRICDFMIGTRKHTAPPLLQDFRDARVREEKQRFEADVRGASDAFERRPMSEILKRLGYAEARTASEAVETEREILRMQAQIAKAEGGGA